MLRNGIVHFSDFLPILLPIKIYHTYASKAKNHMKSHEVQKSRNSKDCRFVGIEDSKNSISNSPISESTNPQIELGLI